VDRSIAAEFRTALVSHIREKIPSGNPALRETIVGPMINAAAREKILDWISQAEKAGARLLTPVHTEGASLLGPVLLENVPADSPALCDEAFAPLAVLQEYSGFSEAIDLVNSSRFGLQAGVFTDSLSKAHRAFAELEVGGVMVNQVPTFRVENMPYGGVKDSGFGREGVRYAMEEMTEPRALVVNRS
jgi:acyl-CoA reductase-like NAD-dependent aldehyde dehydrogenase